MVICSFLGTGSDMISSGVYVCYDQDACSEQRCFCFCFFVVVLVLSKHTPLPPAHPDIFELVKHPRRLLEGSPIRVQDVVK